MVPLSDWQKVKRVVIGFLFDYLPIRRFWRFLKTEWRGLKAGKALLIVACTVSCGLGVWGGCRIEQYRLATAGAPRSEREWPALTDTQIQEWVETLKSYPNSTVAVLFNPEVEAIEFYRSVKNVGKRLGWEFYPGHGGPEEETLEIQVAATVDHQPTAQIITRLLNQMNYPAKFVPEEGKEGAIVLGIPEKSR
jgi:hypothetical protein